MSPERLMVEDFSRYGQTVSLVCIDEIHCSSEWSHNFRPAFFKLQDVINNKFECNLVLGLTATATRDTEKSICQEFQIENVIRHHDLSRANLNLTITRDTEYEKMQNLKKLILSEDYKSCKSIIIYCTYRYTCEAVSRYLMQSGIESKAYHAEKSDVERGYIQDCFNKNVIRCIVCTIAFSMGIDKKDVNSVIHYDMPQSIESYVQEIGRAGRDGNLAKCHLIMSDTNYYSLRQILLSNLVDQDTCFKFTVKLMKQIKEIAEEGKIQVNYGKRKHMEVDVDKSEYIVNKETKEIKFDKPRYIFIPVDDLCQELDIKKEVALTLFAYLEKYYQERDGEYFIRLYSCMNMLVKVKFYKDAPAEVAKESELIK